MKWHRQVVTAKGESLENGATNFYAVHQDPETMAENVSQAFLSLSIGCAKCHDHRLRSGRMISITRSPISFHECVQKGGGGDARNGDGVRTLYVEPRGDLIQPRTGKPQIPAPLDGDEIAPEDTGDRREALAEWLTAGENPFSPAQLRIASGLPTSVAGFVDPVDDLRASNPASNGPLLDALSAHLVEKTLISRR